VTRTVRVLLATLIAVTIVGFTVTGLRSQGGQTRIVTRTITVIKRVQAKSRTVTRWRTRTVMVPAVTPPTPNVNGATWAITIDSCTEMQCTTSPGAGPMGSTCGAVVGNQQTCVGGP
jgi:hypothetical protein